MKISKILFEKNFENTFTFNYLEINLSTYVFIFFTYFSSLLQQNSGKKTTVGDIENVLDGNICRCTGYRPIFDAFKSFASTDFDTPDIEDIVKCQGSGQCSRSRGVGQIKTINGTWYIPTSLDDLLKVLNDLPNGTSYRLVHGNTGRGLYNF